MNKAVARALYKNNLGVLARAYRSACERLPDALLESISIHPDHGPSWEGFDFAGLATKQSNCLPVAVNIAWMSSTADALTVNQRSTLNEEAARFLDKLNGLPYEDEKTLRFDPEFALETCIRHIMMQRLKVAA